MLNQQDCSKLQQQARPLVAQFDSALPPAAIWPLCLARDRLHDRLLPAPEVFTAGSQPGVLEVRDGALPGDWLELPAEWEAPRWVRYQRFLPRKACLSWQLSLEPIAAGTRLECRLLAWTPLSLQPALQQYFKRLSLAFGQALRQLEAQDTGWLEAALPALDAAPASLVRPALHQLRWNRWIDPLALARDAEVPLAQAFDGLEACVAAGQLARGWWLLDPEPGKPIDGWGLAAAGRWPTDSLSAEGLGLRYYGPELPPAPHRLAALSSEGLRCWLWPEQSREVHLAAGWKRWRLLDSSQARVSGGRLGRLPEGEGRLNLAEPQARLTLPTDGRLRLHNPTNRIQGFCAGTARGFASTAADLLSCEAARDVLLASWPTDAVLSREASFLAFDKPLPAAIQVWLSQRLPERDGATLATGLLCFERPAAALGFARELLQLWLRLGPLMPARLRLALDHGRAQLLHVRPQLRLDETRAGRLQQLLQAGKGLDVILPEQLLHDRRLQAELRSGSWQITAFAHADETWFQLRL